MNVMLSKNELLGNFEVETRRDATDAVACPRLADALSYWQALPRKGVLPDRSAFDPIDLWPMMPMVAFTEPQPDGDHHCRVLGTDLCRIYGRDLTNRLVSALRPVIVADRLIDHLGAVVESGQPELRRLILRGMVPSGKRAIGSPEFRSLTVWRLVLPFSTDGGRSVDRLLAIDSSPEPIRVLEAWFKAAQASLLDPTASPVPRPGNSSGANRGR